MLQEWSMVKNLSCVSCAAWNGFPINSLMSPHYIWDAPPTIVATAQGSCTMRHFQPFLCQWCPPQCQTCHICQNLSKMKVQHLENKCQNWSKLGAFLKTDKSIPVYFQSSISKGKINLAYKVIFKRRLGDLTFSSVRLADFTQAYSKSNQIT